LGDWDLVYANNGTVRTIASEAVPSCKC
jgi:hypothetical protein